jgi:acetyltransferase EpsM
MKKTVIIIGYSGHAFVICDIFASAGREVTGYCENEFKELNPFHLTYHGSDATKEGIAVLRQHDYFIGIGNNTIRSKIQRRLNADGLPPPTNAIHPTTNISATTKIGNGVMISSGVSINPLSHIGNGVICNTGCIIEHENSIDDFAHIGPRAVLCGNVSVGEKTFVGAGAVVKEGISIGRNCMIGAGSVIIRNIPNDTVVVGNPGRIINDKLS